MMLQQKAVVKKTLSKGINNPALPGNHQTDLRSSVESLLRDVAVVLHATQVVRRAIEADRTACATAS
jgi:hypothetical protein